MSWVFPGVWDIFASPFFCTSMFMSDDFPTLERPINAYSGITGGGNLSVLVLLNINSADLMIIRQS
jgi:hypothetical protein